MFLISQSPLTAIAGKLAFNSGKASPRNSFMYTFDDEGVFTVMSQGAPTCSCQVHVLHSGVRVSRPQIESASRETRTTDRKRKRSDESGGIVRKGHEVQIKCSTPNARIYYTTDGSMPELHKLSEKGNDYYKMDYVKSHIRGLPKVTS